MHTRMFTLSNQKMFLRPVQIAAGIRHNNIYFVVSDSSSFLKTGTAIRAKSCSTISKGKYCLIFSVFNEEKKEWEGHVATAQYNNDHNDDLKRDDSIHYKCDEVEFHLSRAQLFNAKFEEIAVYSKDSVNSFYEKITHLCATLKLTEDEILERITNSVEDYIFDSAWENTKRGAVHDLELENDLTKKLGVTSDRFENFVFHHSTEELIELPIYDLISAYIDYYS